MARIFAIALLASLAACAATVVRTDVGAVSPCQDNETSYACQVERYNNVNQ
jgi:hypothetical protein